MIVTGDDNCYSLSRLQVYMWTVVVALGFAAVSFATGQFATIPRNLALLMGINLGAAVAATAITTGKDAAAQARGAAPSAPAASTAPSFVRDIFFETGVPASLDLPRAQMFLWTLVTIVTYVVLFLQKFPPSTELPDVPNGMLALMGVSQGAYLGGKAAK
jgi:hypothetical protein